MSKKLVRALLEFIVEQGVEIEVLGKVSIDEALQSAQSMREMTARAEAAERERDELKAKPADQWAENAALVEKVMEQGREIEGLRARLVAAYCQAEAEQIKREEAHLQGMVVAGAIGGYTRKKFVDPLSKSCGNCIHHLTEKCDKCLDPDLLWEAAKPADPGAGSETAPPLEAAAYPERLKRLCRDCEDEKTSSSEGNCRGCWIPSDYPYHPHFRPKAAQPEPQDRECSKCIKRLATCPLPKQSDCYKNPAHPNFVPMEVKP